MKKFFYYSGNEAMFSNDVLIISEDEMIKLGQSRSIHEEKKLP